MKREPPSACPIRNTPLSFHVPDMMIDHAVFETKAHSDRFLHAMESAGFSKRKYYGDWSEPGPLPAPMGVVCVAEL